MIDLKMKRYRHKPIVIEVIQFDGKNYQEVIDFIGFHQAYYVENHLGAISNLGIASSGPICWLTKNCFISRQYGLCAVHADNFDEFLDESYDEIEV